jgi:regulation of enolase protein 1 (concanavalin A-like superfamily)
MTNTARVILSALLLFLASFGVQTVQPVSAQASFPLRCDPVFADQFDGEVPESAWTWSDPGDDTLHGVDVSTQQYVLTSTVVNNYTAYDQDNGPRLLRAITSTAGMIEARVTFTPNGDYAGAGLFLYKDANNFVRYERGLGIYGQAVALQVFDNGRWSYIPLATSFTTVDLRLRYGFGKVTAFYKTPSSTTWQTVGTLNLTTSGGYSGGLTLNTAHAAQAGSVARFDFYSACAEGPAPYTIQMPMMRRPRIGSISGIVKQGGAPVGAVTVELRKYTPGSGTPSSLVIEMQTDAQGFYTFTSPLALPAGQAYYVLYRNPERQSPNGRMAAFLTEDVTVFDIETQAVLPSFDIADIALGAPYDPEFIVEANLPLQFNWSGRTGVSGEQCRLNLESEDGKTRWSSEPVSGGSYRLGGRPPGFGTNPTFYLWYVSCASPAGEGFSWASGAVAFNN